MSKKPWPPGATSDTHAALMEALAVLVKLTNKYEEACQERDQLRVLLEAAQKGNRDAGS